MVCFDHVLLLNQANSLYLGCEGPDFHTLYPCAENQMLAGEHTESILGIAHFSSRYVEDALQNEIVQFNYLPFLSK
jgi:hypothetical protein